MRFGMFTESFSDTVVRLMAARRLSYRQLAEACGISAGYLNHVVKGRRDVPANDVIVRIADALGVSPRVFIDFRMRVALAAIEDLPEVRAIVVNAAEFYITSRETQERMAAGEQFHVKYVNSAGVFSS